MGRYAVLLVLALTFALMTYGHGLRNSFFIAEMELNRNFSSSQARNIAQSAAFIGLQRIFDETPAFTPAGNTLVQIPSGGDFSPWAQMQGDYRFEVANQADTLILLRAIGRFNQSQYTVEVSVGIGEDVWDPDLSRALFSGTQIELGGSSGVVGGHVGTNATAVNSVTLGWSAFIDSSLAIGPGGLAALTVNNARPMNANIGLGVTNLPAEVTYELPEFPDFPAGSVPTSPILTSGSTNRTIGPSDFENRYIPEIRIQSNTQVTINVGNEDRVIHVGRLDIQQGHIRIVGDGHVTFFVEDYFHLGGSSSMNFTRDPETTFVYYRGSNTLDFAGSTTYRGGIYAQTANVRIGGSGGIQGNIITGGTSVEIFGNAEANSRVLFAPNAHVQLTGSGRIRGAVVANRFTATGNTRVFFATEFDDAFPEMRGGGSKTKFVRSWR